MFKDSLLESHDGHELELTDSIGTWQEKPLPAAPASHVGTASSPACSVSMQLSFNVTGKAAENSSSCQTPVGSTHLAASYQPSSRHSHHFVV